jgi:SnoaL-like protein
MHDVKEVVARYIAAWNERDAARRRELIAKTYTEDANYTDPHRSGDGHDGIDTMIAAGQERFQGYSFRLKDSIEAHNGCARFQWEAGGTSEAPLHFVGTDFIVVSADGRLQSVTGFVDEAPATPPNQ